MIPRSARATSTAKPRTGSRSALMDTTGLGGEWCDSDWAPTSWNPAGGSITNPRRNDARSGREERSRSPRRPRYSNRAVARRRPIPPPSSTPWPPGEAVRSPESPASAISRPKTTTAFAPALGADLGSRPSRPGDRRPAAVARGGSLRTGRQWAAISARQENRRATTRPAGAAARLGSASMTVQVGDRPVGRGPRPTRVAKPPAGPTEGRRSRRPGYRPGGGRSGPSVTTETSGRHCRVESARWPRRGMARDGGRHDGAPRHRPGSRHDGDLMTPATGRGEREFESLAELERAQSASRPSIRSGLRLPRMPPREETARIEAADPACSRRGWTDPGLSRSAR